METGSQSGWEIELPRQSLEIGRGDMPSVSGSRIELPEPTISRRQARLEWRAPMRAFVLIHEPAATNPTRLNGSRIQEEPLVDGDVINMGQMRLKIVGVNRPLTSTGYGAAIPKAAEVATAPVAAPVPLSDHAASTGCHFTLRVVKGQAEDVGRTFPLEPRLLGSSSGVTVGGPGGRAAFALADSNIADAQIKIETHRGELRVVPLLQSPQTIMRGMPLLSACPLVGGEVIGFGNTLIQVDVVDALSGRTVDAILEILQTKNTSLPPSIPLTAQTTTIGRVEPADIVVIDISVSSLHATLIKHNGGHVIKHESKTNKTLVNGYTVHNQQRLAHGDVIRLGTKTLLRYIIPK